MCLIFPTSTSVDYKTAQQYKKNYGCRTIKTILHHERKNTAKENPSFIGESVEIQRLGRYNRVSQWQNKLSRESER